MPLYNAKPQSDHLPVKDGDEYKRTNNKLTVDGGDAPSGKKLADPRLPKLFKYQFGGQSGYITIPKGRIVSVAPDKEFKDFQENKFYNALTIANGGQDVTERNDNPALKEPGSEDYTRVANKPVGVSQINTYQNKEDQFEGNLPSFITRNTINLPYFGTQKEAEKMDWGSAYGDLKPGDKVKSDENGRFVKWEENKEMTQVFDGDGTKTTFQMKTPLNPDIEAADVEAVVGDTEVDVDSITHATGEITLTDAPESGTENVEITFESLRSDDVEQQVGQVVNVNREMIPAGWLKWAMPEPNPNGEEDTPTGFEAEHLTPEGYPYDEKYKEGYGAEDYKATGIPGLTNGSELTKEFKDQHIGDINVNAEAEDKHNFHIENLGSGELIKGELEVKLVDTEGTVVNSATDDEDSDLINFVNYEEGLVIVELQSDATDELDVVVDYKATGQYPGLPSNLNWEGVIGSVDILLQF